MVQYLEAEDVMRVHLALVGFFADQGDPIAPAGARPGGLLESAVGRPRTSLGSTDKYPSLELKAAALLHSLVTSHPFHNGNKRTGLVSTLAFLEHNGKRFTAPDDELFDFVLAVANKEGHFGGDIDQAVQNMATWLQDHLLPERPRHGEMRTQEFLARCEAAGCANRLTKQGGSWVVRGPNRKSITISASTRKLAGNVVRTYLNRLGLSETASGVHRDEFLEGVTPEQELIRQFRAVLGRLAHA